MSSRYPPEPSQPGSMAPTAWAAAIDSSIIAEFASAGRMRAMINLGNPLLARLDAANQQPVGVSVDLATRFAQGLGVALELMPVATASEAVDAVTRETADIGFFAVDPVRGAGITFTAPYVLIEGSYLVAADSALTANDQVDRDGHRVVVGQGSAYDLFLSRELKHATIVRAPSSQHVVATFIAQSLDVAAGVRQQLEADARGRAGLRLLPGGFMTIRQAMGLPKSRSAAAAAVLRQFVEAMKAEGFVRSALQRHGIEGAGVAPQSSTMC